MQVHSLIINYYTANFNVVNNFLVADYKKCENINFFTVVSHLCTRVVSVNMNRKKLLRKCLKRIIKSVINANDDMLSEGRSSKNLNILLNYSSRHIFYEIFKNFHILLRV